MRFKFKITVAIFFGSAIILLTTCKPTEYSSIPFLTYKSFKVLQYYNSTEDSALVLTVSFVDGDGDLGLSQADTIAPFDHKSPYYNNWIADYYEKVDGKFTKVRPEIEHIPYGDTIIMKYRFPVIPTQTNNKTLKGDIEITMNTLSPVRSHTIKFAIYIYDRALHKSNTVETPAIDY